VPVLPWKITVKGLPEGTPPLGVPLTVIFGPGERMPGAEDGPVQITQRGHQADAVTA